MGVAARRCILEELGYKITTATDPLEALSLFHAQPFDLVITDLRMPRLNGLELMSRIREIKPETPVILISGFAEILGLTEENTGASAIIHKSANEVQQLVRAVARVLKKQAPAKRRPQREGEGKLDASKTQIKDVS